MAKVTHAEAGAVYDASGRSWEKDAARPWLMACAAEVAVRVVRRVEGQRRAQVGARATRPVDEVPAWLEEGIRRGRGLAGTVTTGVAPMDQALRLIATAAPTELVAWLGPNAALPDVLSALSSPRAALDAARVVSAEPRANAATRVFYETLRVVYLAEERGAPKARDVTLLAGAVGLDRFEGLDGARKKWEDRIRRWSREPRPRTR